MPELRWTLLVVGVVFLAALAWWELRRQRQSPRGNVQHRQSASGDPTVSPPRQHREPSISLPEIRGRETPQELPVVEIDDDAGVDLRAEGPAPAETAAPERMLIDPPLGTGPQQAVMKPIPAAAGVLQVALPTEPIVEWPDEGQRKIVALRLVAPPQERFAGHSVRQALAAEGFVLGKFDIFHKAGSDARAVLSVASLTRPGTFDLVTMDTQRFGGLSLFAVLPGPLAPPLAFDELLATARNLNGRLAGALQDERGQPLTPTRSAAIRQGLEDPGS